MEDLIERYAFRMHLNPGARDEYRRRHDAIWPDLVELLQDAGVSDYSIFLDEETDTLFGVLMRRADHRIDALPQSRMMQRWWAHMADVMRTHPDNPPLATPLAPVFHMP